MKCVQTVIFDTRYFEISVYEILGADCTSVSFLRVFFYLFVHLQCVWVFVTRLLFWN